MSSDLEYARDLDYEPEPDSYSEMVSDIDAANGGPIDRADIVIENEPTAIAFDDPRSSTECGAAPASQSEISYAQGIDDERDRIRTEFAAWAEVLPVAHRDLFLAELDRICRSD